MTTEERQTNIKNAKKLFTSLQSKCVRFCAEHQCVRIRPTPDSKEWRSVGGMLEQIQRIFYWDYNYFRARTRTRKRKSESSALMLAEKRRIGTDGMELGKQIDEEANVFVTRCVLLGENVDEAMEDMTLYTRKLIAAKKLWGWQPLVAQYAIAIPALSIGTCIDSLEVDADYKLIAVEHKYGYQEYLYSSNANMDGPLQDISNCPLNQHFLQVGMATLILEAIYNVKVHRAFVVYVDDYEVRPHELPSWFHERRKDIWEAFVNGMAKRLPTSEAKSPARRQRLPRQ